MNKKFHFYLTLLLFVGCIDFNEKEISYSTTGPETGSLILVGGNMSHPEIYQQFMNLAGGFNSQIVLVLTAASDDLLNDKN